MCSSKQHDHVDTPLSGTASNYAGMHYIPFLSYGVLTNWINRQSERFRSISSHAQIKTGVRRRHCERSASSTHWIRNTGR